MVLRCKMKTQSLQAIKNADGSIAEERIVLDAVSGPENEPWSKYTPTGQLSFSLTNPSAFGKIKADEEYYVDIVPVKG
jgi:hypothetical protein